MRLFFIALFFLISLSASFSQVKKKIEKILQAQDTYWNRGDIEGFMKTYWQDDSLMFIGKSGVTYGWNNTLNNYKRSYPDVTAMGQLHFDLIQIKKLSRKYYFVVGKWYLSRTIGDLQGHFTLLIKKIRNHWVIIADHSS